MTKEQRTALRDLLTHWDKEAEYADEGTMRSMSESLWTAITYRYCTKQLREILKENFEDWGEDE